VKILICGGRDFYKFSLLKDTLEDLFSNVLEEDEEVVIIAGGAPGADFLAKVFALDEYKENWWLSYKEFPADWKTHGKAAGAIRNQQMLDEGEPELVVAFPGGNGTADMVKRAKRAGVKVLEVV